LFLMSRPGVPDVRNGQYVLENHGKLIKTWPNKNIITIARTMYAVFPDIGERFME
jgi:hypothetical protein